jgi:methyl-accepting chemotaxis protein
LSNIHQREAIFVKNEKKKIKQMVAYTPISDEKFVDEIGWQVFAKVDADEIMHELHAAERRFIIGLSGVSIISLFFALLVARVFKAGPEKTGIALTTASEDLSRSVIELASLSNNLKETVSDQGSATEKTSAAVNEINAMCERNVDLVETAQIAGSECLQASSEADESTSRLKENMDEIKNTNKVLETTINSTLSEMQTLVNSVNEIADKTSLINEIVFQTKLLSFNASVEAARAGENGKGFSVVAEEIGQLATSSGDAAKQISDIVEKSLSQVSTLVQNSQKSLEEKIKDANNVVEDGHKSTLKLATKLNLISTKSKELESLILQISEASKEQQLGVRDINDSLIQISKGNQSIQSGVTSNQGLSRKFKELATSLSFEEKTMQKLVHGQSRPKNSKAALKVLKDIRKDEDDDITNPSKSMSS